MIEKYLSKVRQAEVSREKYGVGRHESVFRKSNMLVTELNDLGEILMLLRLRCFLRTH